MVQCPKLGTEITKGAQALIAPKKSSKILMESIFTLAHMDEGKYHG